MSRPSLYRSTLPNGLRLVVQPLDGAPSVGVAVHYDVGFRSEPLGRTGFAHLFEHVMFQGSENVAPADHFRHVQASGGTANGSTHQDHTDYYQVVPAQALERVLFLEADRMRALRITPETLRTQTAVVKEEIRQSVTDKPYGGFPWTVLPAVLYRTHPNAHNGYGAFDDLDAATVAECQAFFDTYYAPGNAVVTICGDVDPGHAADLVARHFAAIPARPVPAPPALAEPVPQQARYGTHPIRTPRSRRPRSAGACPTRAPASTAISRTWCSASSSPAGTLHGSSIASCTARRWPPTSARAAGCSGHCGHAIRRRSCAWRCTRARPPPSSFWTRSTRSSPASRPPGPSSANWPARGPCSPRRHGAASTTSWPAPARWAPTNCSSAPRTWSTSSPTGSPPSTRRGGRRSGEPASRAARRAQPRARYRPVPVSAGGGSLVSAGGDAR
ncbi:insulinase family protein [Streptomyces mirabilis]|nr:insulinase family protein [Streptomyces mirabilis]